MTRNAPTRALISGTLLGRHLSPGGAMRGAIVQIGSEQRPDGPAENAFVYVDMTHAPGLRARYIAWINLYDIENAARRQPGEWELVQPGEPTAVRASWLPFGWGGPALPSIADVV